MDPATGGALAYGAETAVETGVAAYFLTQPTLPLKATLQHISFPSSTSLSCSGHTFSVISDKAYIFGGESEDGKEASNDVQELQLATNDDKVGTPGMFKDVKTITAIGENGQIPPPRSKHTAAIARDRIFIFGGCSPSSPSSPLSEPGRLWVFDPLNSSWLFPNPPPRTDFLLLGTGTQAARLKMRARSLSTME